MENYHLIEIKDGKETIIMTASYHDVMWRMSELKRFPGEYKVVEQIRISTK